MERHARSNLIKLLFADDESDVSSTICEDPADQNQIQSQDELKVHIEVRQSISAILIYGPLMVESEILQPILVM